MIYHGKVMVNFFHKLSQKLPATMYPTTIAQAQYTTGEYPLKKTINQRKRVLCTVIILSTFIKQNKAKKSKY